jgi:Mrp family chromosome partitioning ATPase/capsular polysaccharide biosynthesis protein
MNETTEATAIFTPLWKRKWQILAVAILVAAATYGYYQRQATVYQATAQTNGGAETQEAATPKKGRRAKKAAAAAASGAQAQAAVSPIVHEVVANQLRTLIATPTALTALRGIVKAEEKGGFILISAEAETEKAAALLANTTANVYVIRRNEAQIAATKAAILVSRKQLQALELALIQQPNATLKGRGRKASGSASVALQAADLSTHINQLESELAVQGVRQIGKAKGARLIGPMPKQNALFGFAMALFLASIAAYFLSRFDRRLQSLTAIESVFQTHILSALPSVRHPLVARDGQLAPAPALSDPLRRLHAGLELTGAVIHGANGAGEQEPERPLRSILFLSPDAGDGKSTVIATLALVQRESDAQVVVVEANFRRPVQARLLDVMPAQGLADVLTGTLALDRALQEAESVPRLASSNSTSSRHAVTTVLESRGAGTLSVLVGGTGVPNPPALLARRSMADLLASLAEEFDYTLIDAPSPLQVSDVMPLLPVVDGIVLVARIGHTRETSARRLAQVLARTPSAPILGVVANDVSRGDLERYGFHSHGERRWLGKLTRQ